MKRIRTVKQLAEALRVTANTVRNWQAKGLPSSKRGWDVDEVREWTKAMRAASRRARIPKQLGLEPVEDLSAGRASGGREAAETRFREARADKIELELRVQRGELIERSLVDEMLVTRMSALRRRLRKVPRSLAPELANEPQVMRIQTRLEEALDLVLWEIYGRAPEEADQKPERKRRRRGKAL